jgi:hypothetical protein
MSRKTTARPVSSQTSGEVIDKCQGGSEAHMKGKDAAEGDYARW